MEVEAVNIHTFQAPRKSYAGLIIILVVIALLAFAWTIARPGIFTIQPNAAMPYGMTIIYYSRSGGMSFFSSPDGLCLRSEGSVTLLCRMSALGAAANLSNRVLFQLPYSRWAYLKSTGGLEFGQ